MKYKAVIEQTFEYPKRMNYISETDSFVETACSNLLFDRNVHQPYGWIKASGTPPNDHLDVIIMTDKKYNLGDEVIIKIIGVFCRNDGDHKLVAVLENRDINDFSELKISEKEDMHRLYPYEAEGEGWFGREVAQNIIRGYNGVTGLNMKTIRATEANAEEILVLQKKEYLSEAKINNDYTIPPLVQTIDELVEEFKECQFLIALEDDKIIGSVKGKQIGDTCHIGRLIVDSEYQNRGIGSRLMKMIEKKFEGVSKFELFTGNKSSKNIYLYKKLGYEVYKEEQLNENTGLVFMVKRVVEG